MAGAFPAIRAGALSYVLKEIGPEELADAIRKAAKGEAVLHPRVATQVVADPVDGAHDLVDVDRLVVAVPLAYLHRSLLAR